MFKKDINNYKLQNSNKRI